MKILSVVGTRPNFIKELLVNQEMHSRGHRQALVHTGQHYDYEMSRIFFKQLGLPDPDYHLQVNNSSGTHQTAEMLTAIDDIMEAENPDVTLVYGDVTSTLAGALASVRREIPVAHVEAGIRTEAFYNPEEINRRGTDALSELLLANVQDAYDRLIAEGHPERNVMMTGDVMNDVLQKIVRECNVEVKRGDYCVCTLHRAEDVDNPERLSAIVNGLVDSGERILFPIHPRTRKRLEEFNLVDKLESAGNIELSRPKGYLEFVRMLAGANKVITDSGGVRREAYILGKPVIVVIGITWFPCILRTGWKKVTDANTEAIVDAIRNFEPNGERPELFGDGRAYVKIVDAIIDRFGNR